MSSSMPVGNCFLVISFVICLTKLACTCRYGNANVWKIFTDLFDYFPLTALVSTNTCIASLFPYSYKIDNPFSVVHSCACVSVFGWQVSLQFEMVCILKCCVCHINCIYLLLILSREKSGQSLRYNSSDFLRVLIPKNSEPVHLISYILVYRWSQKYSAFTVDYHHQSRPLTTLGTLIEFKKFRMKGLCVTYYGLILMTDVVGESLLVVPDIHLVRY